jgi:hypothetical protein
MHASSTQSIADLRTPAKAALAAIIFAAGIVVGAVAGTTVVPVTAPQSINGVSFDTDAPWFRENRARERGDGGANRPSLDQDASHPGTGGR